MQEVEDELLCAERAAGIDIAKAGAEVNNGVRSDNGAGRRQQETGSYGNTGKQLLSLADWLRGLGRDQGGDGRHLRLLETGLLRPGNSRGLTASATTRRKWRPCPSGVRQTGPTRRGWRGTTSEGKLTDSYEPRERNGRLRNDTRYRRHRPRPAAPRNSEWKNCSRMST